ncbi:hypothetical protein J8J14_16890 [Roseomonas sp. SSH11]|uniref:HTH luxR-type domain-containing protein n=1 Tax=Pararoseomonas baculiformis TaxID=2820812 RepID=A0ABS4AJR4_9PROT|nr:hypothetical protein [Pararoseomonas baculiformis]MBP0446454.1 hypothetical protein [Pararoseomonas baculiformis]
MAKPPPSPATPPRPILDLAALAYDAAAGEACWHDVAQALTTALGATGTSLWVGDAEAGRVDILRAIPGAAPVYTTQRYGPDPWIRGFLAAARPAMAEGAPPIILGPGDLPDEAYRRSDFYAGFARQLGPSHLVGNLALQGEPGCMPMGFHRPEGSPPFGAEEQAALGALFPHLRRALRLRQRLRQSAAGPHHATAALEALPIAAIAVDADLRIARTNAAAEALLRAGTGLRLLRVAPPPSPVRLGAARSTESSELARLVRRIAQASGQDNIQGGSLRISPPDPEGGPPLAVLATPLPAHLIAVPPGNRQGRLPGLVLLAIREIGIPRSPSPWILADLFGLSAAEASVAIALAGGATAEAVAAQRRVGLATVRAQIRTILEKTGASGLRDLERILATLGDGRPGPRPVPAPRPDD